MARRHSRLRAILPGVAPLFRTGIKKVDAGCHHRSRDSDDKVQFPTTLFKIIFANDTLSATVLNSRGLGVEMRYARGSPSIFRAIRVTVQRRGTLDRRCHTIGEMGARWEVQLWRMRSSTAGGRTAIWHVGTVTEASG